jgi:hypothetical protein
LELSTLLFSGYPTDKNLKDLHQDVVGIYVKNLFADIHWCEILSMFWCRGLTPKVCPAF